ncbi:MAG: hypothetical protein SGJ19_06340 [Planctomycetia bacterium]|nr:hypothetical protein [Planctomycetia bacterium]
MHLIVGGIAANLLVIWSLANVAIGGEGSHISRDRRLPSDSDGQLFGMLFAVGGLCGLGVAVITGFPQDPLYLGATAAVAFVVGLVVTLPRVAKLNESYLSRAATNLEEGNYKEALEDASEVARSSERLRERANQIVEAAREMRNRQPLGGLSL